MRSSVIERSIVYYKKARADNCVEKVTQQWHDRDQTESLNATVDSCFAVIAARYCIVIVVPLWFD